ncbi:MAG TPA: M56 family metallopeptidase [Thermoplasmata archaeon]|nr:M56 family metallopeptidase [Thermoplasmata archaeon]
MALLALVLYAPVVVWVASGAGLVYAFRKSAPTTVLRLASAFLALWSLLATTFLVWVLENGGWMGLVRISHTPPSLLAATILSDPSMWAEGALGAFTILLVAFLLNQAVGRGTLRLLNPSEMPWPRGLAWPAFPVQLLQSRSLEREAFSFTLLSFAGGRWHPHRLEVIILSGGLVELLSEPEVAAVVAHEVGHLRGLDGRYLTYLRTLSRMMRWDPLMAFIAARLTDREEFRADDDAVRATGLPLALARALYKAIAGAPVPRRFWAVGFLGTRGSAGHPQAIARIRRLVAMAEARQEPEAWGG